jgi:multiple sugar transport system permease protein
MPIVGKSVSNRKFARARLLTTLILILFGLYSAIPLVYLVVSATKTENDLFTTFGLWFGRSLNIGENLRMTFSYQNGIFLRWLFNSAWYSTVIAVTSTTFSAAAGYAFAKFQFPGKNVLFAAIVVALMVPQTAMVVPLFLMMTGMGIIDTPAAFVLPSLAFPLGVYLMRVYTDQGVPSELLEAARIDGANEFVIFITVALRLVAPGLVTVLLLSFVSSWNNYFLPLVALVSPQNFPVTVGLASWYQVSQGGGVADSIFAVVMMGALISVLPIIVAFLVLQRFWESGLTAGGVK